MSMLAPQMSAGMAGLGLSAGLPSYGMAMRFAVSVGGLSLGHWSACKGLKLDLKVSRLKEGGNYGSDQILPEQVSGSSITLERAMEQTDSVKLQKWLREVASEWTSYSGTGRPYKDRTAKITLFDVGGIEMASWTLSGVFPSSWSGPSLSATDNKVAIETLVLEYEAITAGAEVPAPAVSKAALTDGSDTVAFHFNPEKISVSHSAKLEEITTDRPSAEHETRGRDFGYEDSLKEIGPTTIGLSGATFDGPGVVTACEQLLRWTNAVKPTGATHPKLPLLTFSWGSFKWDVRLMSADISYTRFSTQGTPIRAQVTLKCISNVNPPTHTNPTSGGLAGRRSHVVVASENLQHVAMANYGRPGDWRAVAAANGIEDPLRVRPGAVIYLPAAEELTPGGPA
jgi:phage tail-like protein